ncbi:MAG: response regulator [Candidatus Riflebacteria bacterium]|nr:response regulator [Candidatus Riflebacteria bacterium]
MDNPTDNASSSATVLLVEDSSFDRHWLQDALSRAGFSVHTADSFETAWDVLQSTAVETVVSDIVLPSASGLELLRRLHEAAPTIPVVLITASDKLDTAVEAVREHAFDFLRKPVSAEQLVASVQAAAGEQSRRRARLREVQDLRKGVRDALTLNADIVESLTSGLLVVGNTGEVLLVNRTAERFLHLRREDLLGRDFRTIAGLDPLSEPIARGLAGALESGQESLEFTCPGGQRIWLGYTLSQLHGGAGEAEFPPPQPSPGGGGGQPDQREGSRAGVSPVLVRRQPGQTVLGVIVHFSDISEKRQLEAAIIQTDKLATLGTMASALAHEINNPMTIMLGNLDVISARLADSNPALVERVSLVSRNAWRCVEIVRSFLKIARPQKGTQGAIRIDDIVKDLLLLLSRDLSMARIQVTQELDALGAQLDVNASQLQQVLLNLILNARDAMPGGGVLTIRSSLGDDQVAIEVSDTGVGIAAEHLHHIFDTFFTTKGPGRGTGLGLSICRILVEGMKGKLEVSSEVGKGTSFVVRLPCALPGRLAGVAVHAASPVRRPLDLDLLVVDDEQLILDCYRDLMARFGCRAAMYSEPAVALREFVRGRFDLAVLDLRMPGMDGFELCRRLHDLEPDLPVLYATGLVVPEVEQQGQGPNVMGFLAKPFSSGELRDWLERASRSRKAGIPAAGLVAGGPAESAEPLRRVYRAVLVSSDGAAREKLARGLARRASSCVDSSATTRRPATSRLCCSLPDASWPTSSGRCSWGPRTT